MACDKVVYGAFVRRYVGLECSEQHSVNAEMPGGQGAGPGNRWS